MSADLTAALCLVVVLEGLLLLVAPDLWKQAMTRMLQHDASSLRLMGGVMIVAGLLALQLFRG